jgi:hypothetical protein
VLSARSGGNCSTPLTLYLSPYEAVNRRGKAVDAALGPCCVLDSRFLRSGSNMYVQVGMYVRLRPVPAGRLCRLVRDNQENLVIRIRVKAGKQPRGGKGKV